MNGPRRNRISRRARTLAVLALVGTLSSCGSLLSRCGSRQAARYHYPGKSVVEDFIHIAYGVMGKPTNERGFELMGMVAQGNWLSCLLSLPFDLVLDTVLLPVDVGEGIYRLASAQRSTWSSARR